MFINKFRSRGFFFILAAVILSLYIVGCNPGTPDTDPTDDSGSEYVAPIYSTPVTKSTNWTTTDPWWGSVFGDIGGASFITDGTSLSITEGATEIILQSGTSSYACGKISESSDGIAIYFQKIGGDKDFSLSATATVVSAGNSDQVSFGLMVRDEMWIDLSDSHLLGSYVVAGPLKMTSTACTAADGPWSTFFRNTKASPQLSGTAFSSSSLVPTAGNSYNLSISKTGTTYTVKFGSETAATYSLDLTDIDADYDFVGMFTAGQCKVTFSNISLTVSP